MDLVQLSKCPLKGFHTPSHALGKWKHTAQWWGGGSTWAWALSCHLCLSVGPFLDSRILYYVQWTKSSEGQAAFEARVLEKPWVSSIFQGCLGEA